MSTSSVLRETIQQAIKDAMRAKEKARLSVLRMLSAEIKQKEVDQRITMDDAGIIQVIEKMLKQRRESKKQYAQANRKDLADQEQYEIGILQVYMPTALTADEIAALIQAAIKKSGASSAKDMGQVMAILRPQIQGRADMAAVSKQVKSELS